ncbi:autotransporter [Devosia epidermidihirudinis]|uniref:Autotransporter n=1 Tax=Devosia epidermidihirudinis TaxID=1293439 RepID=A0A0F5Q9H3_9HYPH|nr:autotransporter domain-containing protein [Devosia epidermidihirudinis]KKC37371.1 autotransporter [Devosia epidermidihirudinis]
MRYPTRRRLTGLALSSTHLILLISASLAVVVWHTGEARADCSALNVPNLDAYTCDFGTYAGSLNDPTGNNTLLFPTLANGGGTGVIAGNVVFGIGNDLIEMHTGRIDGDVDQGAGADRFVITGGVVVGNVQQGAGIDDFHMTGGEIGSLNQGDNRDTFFMSGGRIIDAFDDGDVATMTGGRIGRVNMKLDNNIFDMSGGIIDRNLVTGFGDDIIILSAGTIGGNISVSGGKDSVTVTGGSVGGSVLMSAGEDRFVWDGGGIIYGTIDMGADNDTARLANLTNANMGATPAITGGLGVDSLVLDHVATPGVSRFQAWESIALTNASQLIFDGTLVLGDAGTGTGALSIDQTSIVYGGGFNGAVSAAIGGQLANVSNAGRIDLSNNGAAGDRFTINGNYVGNNGMVMLDTVLGADNSASDRLVISGGVASGATSIGVVNVGGAGAVTNQDGIQVVQAINGATTSNGAFALGGPVAAGAFEYFLFKGGVSAGSGENWYLRSTLVNPPAGAPTPILAPTVPPLQPSPEPPVLPPDPTPAPPPPEAQPAPPVPPEATPADPDPVDPAPPVTITDPVPEAPPAPMVPPPLVAPPAPAAAPTQLPPLPGTTAFAPTPGATPVAGLVVPLYRVEVPTYSALGPSARYLGLATLGTFHERRGRQSLLEQEQERPGLWGRVFGQDVEMKWDGTVAPTFDGNLFGFQAGADVAGWENENGHTDRLGVFAGVTSMNGNIRGQALGWNDLGVGKVGINGTSLGAYWSHVGPEGWYLDGVAMGTWYGGNATSVRGVGIGLDGGGLTLSLEGGYPIALADGWRLEPQAQLIWQHIGLNSTEDRFSPVSFSLDDAVTGRIGVRLEGDVTLGDIALEPYLKANLWHGFGGTDTVSFGGDAISTATGGTSLELGGGVVARLSETVSLFATGDYTTNLGGQSQHAFEANIGLSIKW